MVLTADAIRARKQTKESRVASYRRTEWRMRHRFRKFQTRLFDYRDRMPKKKGKKKRQRRRLAFASTFVAGNFNESLTQDLE